MDYIFDYEGTIMDYSRCIRKAFNTSLLSFGLKSIHIDEEELYFVERILLKSELRKLDDVEFSMFIDSFRQNYINEKKKADNINSNVIEVFKALKEGNHNIFIIGNLPYTEFSNVLESLVLEQYISKSYTADCFRKFKPHPEPLDRIIIEHQLKRENVVYIGDSHYDIRMAKAANVKMIAYVSGVSSLQEMQNETPDKIIIDLMDVIPNIC